MADQQFDPSMLQRKDRAELVAIATSLGEKPPSRAKKADVIEIICRAVGADVPGDAGSSNTDSSNTDSSNEANRGAPAVGGASGPPAEATPSSSDEASADDTAPETDGGSPARAPAGDRTPTSTPRRGGGRNQGATNADQDESNTVASKSAGPSDRSRRDHGSDRGDQHRDGQRQPRAAQGGGSDEGDQPSGNERSHSDDGGSQGNQRHQNQGTQSGGSQGNQQQGDDDSGNRRRRRRGRDRRPEDDAPLPDPVSVVGLVDLRDEGYGFLRIAGYLPSRDDAYISVKQVRQFGLRRGDLVTGMSRPANRNEKNPALLQVDEVNGHKAGGEIPFRPDFEDLTPLFPDSRLTLEQPEFPEHMTARIIDLLAPIGKGQRGLIVSPPKAGKTTVVKEIVRAIERNHPDVHLMVLLVDERPEEVTDMKRWLTKGEVAASTFDRPTEEHIAVAELAIDRAKRLVEAGQDVVLVLDGITRLARAYNLAQPAGGRTMAGGIDTAALYPPKKFFGAARNVEEGGSLTILATALVETNTRMDEVIFEEFKGTGNMELKLDRRLADRRIFPAIDVDASSTRHEELLFDRKQLQQIYRLRRVLSGMADDAGSSAPGLEMLVDRLQTFRTNEAFLAEIAKTPNPT